MTLPIVKNIYEFRANLRVLRCQVDSALVMADLGNYVVGKDTLPAGERLPVGERAFMALLAIKEMLVSMGEDFAALEDAISEQIGNGD